MIIDFHTHIFPDSIAEKVIGAMNNDIVNNYDRYHIKLKAKTNGTANQLIKTMDDVGCDISVLCPVVTNERSTDKINDFSWSQKSDRLIPFASLMPTQTDYERVLENVCERGFKGIKLHPEYQNFYVDDPKIIPVIKKAESLGLIIILHTGKDVCFAPPEKASPERLCNMLDKVDGSKIVCAHLGGWLEWDNVYKYLLDCPMYFDTSCLAGFINKDLCKAIIDGHGAKKVLLGSDSPWVTCGQTLDFLNSLNLSATQKELIYYKNAVELLKL